MGRERTGGRSRRPQRATTAGDRSRDHRHARTGGALWWPDGRAVAPGRGVRRPCPAAGGDGPMIRVLIADDQALVRGAFRVVLDSEPDIEVVAEAVDGGDAIEQTRLRKPDVVLMDVRM